MRSFSDDDTRAFFEALCRVETRGETGQPRPKAARSLATGRDGAAEPGPDGALAALLRELGLADADDDFPDFERERAEARARTVAADAREVAPAPHAPVADPPSPALATADEQEQRDAVVATLLRTLDGYRALLDRYHRELDEASARRAAGAPEPVDEVVARLRGVQEVLVKYPIAAQAAFRALVREGRHYALTDEGLAWKERLRGSPLVARARTLFEGLAAGMVGEGTGGLPSAYVDALVRGVDRDIERVLADVGGRDLDR